MMRYTVLIIMLSLLHYLAANELPDTVVSLQSVTVTASAKGDIIPAQTLQGDELQRVSAQNVADVLRGFAGLQVKDYGGIGGIKTVNVRSMGTNHTGVVYDGVALGNAQNGQIDLGQFSLDNMEALSVYNGQRSSILQPARDFAQAATVYMRTRAPQLDAKNRWRLRARMRSGSFDLVNPSLLYEQRLSRSVDLQVSGEWIYSSGEYRFGYKRLNANGTVAYDTTAVRHNGDIKAFRSEVNIYGTHSAGTWQAKAYSYNSRRGVPGAIVNNVWRRGERIGDSNNFLQGRYSGTWGKFSNMTNFKSAYYRTHYVNNDVATTHIDNMYNQWEVYFSTANMLAISPWWHASVSYDYSYNTMTSDLFGFTRPTRHSHFMSIASSVTRDRFKLQGSLTGILFSDHRRRLPSTSKHVLTPAIYAVATPLASYRDLSVRAFVKRSYRMPTFNDLYYADLGNSALKPERVSQYNIGLTWNLPTVGFLTGGDITVDGYYNRVTDKIVAYPKGQQFRWTMLNLGKVDIRGIDIAANVILQPHSQVTVTPRLRYTYQRVIDITNPSTSYYRDQIPYIPHHSGSASVNATWRDWGLNLTWIYVGERYNQPENITYNYMPSWNSADLSINRSFTIRRVRTNVSVDINNLAGRDYQVILNYPMPRRNYRVTLSIEI